MSIHPLNWQIAGFDRLEALHDGGPKITNQGGRVVAI
jgi:hypothetical protein